MQKPARASPATEPLSAFVAIDFETADDCPDSACAVALVRVEGLNIVDRAFTLIRPPRPHFQFTYLHGIAWRDVADQPTFGESWPKLCSILEGAAFLAAHHAEFDQSVLLACCRLAGISPPALPFQCTVKLARARWGIYPTKLPNVCARLGLTLKHHDACSDAEACARIVIESRKLVTSPGPPAVPQRQRRKGR